MGTYHAGTLATLPTTDLVVVVDAARDAAASVARLHGGCRSSNDPSDAWGDDVDAVVIASPAATHADLVVAAARAGKAVFCEKPLATDLASAQRAADAVASSGVPFQIGFQRRYDPATARLLAAAHAGTLGRLETFRSFTFDPEGPAYPDMVAAAGIFHDTASHDVDLALAALGPVDDVFTRGTSVLDARFDGLGKPDTTLVSLRFASGAIGTIENRLRSGYGYETGLELSGSRAKGIASDDRVDGLVLRRDGREERDLVPWFVERFADAYRSELMAFAAALAAGDAPRPGVAQAVEVMRVCLAIERSYREHRPVELREIVLDGPRGDA